jgi:hypothetical protein
MKIRYNYSLITDKKEVWVGFDADEWDQFTDDEGNIEGKYGTYEELSKLYEDSHANYLALSKLLDTTVGKLAYQNMMLEKAREAYQYITAEDRDKPIE